MFEVLLPYVTILPFAVAVFMAGLGLVPSLLIALGNWEPTGRYQIIAGVSLVFGAWAFVNALVPYVAAHISAI